MQKKNDSSKPKKASIHDLAAKASGKADAGRHSEAKTIKKKITAEDNYFAERDKELIELAKKEKKSKQQEEEKKSYFMKCPQCGETLEKEELENLKMQADKCTSCGGVWLNNKVVEKILSETTLIKSFIKSIFPNMK